MDSSDDEDEDGAVPVAASDGDSVAGDSESEAEYEPESIFAERGADGGGREYLVNWAPPYSDEYTWEPTSSLKHLKVFKDYKKK